MEDYLISSITKIANQGRVTVFCEPEVMQPLAVEEWMTKRVMYAALLLNDKLKKRRKDGNS